MITEDYVGFETAKLLKENGFDEECQTYYGDYKYPCPTLQMTMKWLREVHNIAINVCYLLGMWSYSVYRTDVSSLGFNSEDFDTYEEACEAGIKYCLENLI